jgi:hypothetical protein
MSLDVSKGNNANIVDIADCRPISLTQFTFRICVLKLVRTREVIINSQYSNLYTAVKTMTQIWQTSVEDGGLARLQVNRVSKKIEELG